MIKDKQIDPKIGEALAEIIDFLPRGGSKGDVRDSIDAAIVAEVNERTSALSNGYIKTGDASLAADVFFEDSGIEMAQALLKDPEAAKKITAQLATVIGNKQEGEFVPAGEKKQYDKEVYDNSVRHASELLSNKDPEALYKLATELRIDMDRAVDKTHPDAPLATPNSPTGTKGKGLE